MRLFYGLSLPHDIRLACQTCARECMQNIPGKYTLTSNYHITLAFLGDVPQERLADAERTLSETIRSFSPPQLTLGETSWFGRLQNAILITRVQSEPTLFPLHQALITNLDAASLPFSSGPFSPHITLARHVRIPETPLPHAHALSFVPLQASLFLSARNDQDILTYSPLYSASFSSKSV